MPIEPNPDFNRLLKALRCEQPDRVPLCELLMDAEAKAAFLGRPVQSTADDVEFWYKAGYDYVALPPRFGFSYGQGEQVRDGFASEGRTWAVENKGTVLSLSDLEKNPIPTLD